MINIPEYQIFEKLYESQNSIIFRAKRIKDGKSVIIKLFNKEYPSEDELNRFSREYEIISNLNNLDFNGTIKTYSIEKYHNTLIIVMEDFYGLPLSSILGNNKIEVDYFLRLAIKIVDILEVIHNKNIIHKDINPSNILLNRETDEIKIIDFGISKVVKRETPEIRDVNNIEGTLLYISPEQTGRMNRSIDYRTDYYSLGVTFYEMLTGQCPFESEDAMEIVHFHIAKSPQPIEAIRPEIPKVISDIVMKLMGKTAEARYQSSFGIKADLKECLYQLQTSNGIKPFVIGQKDVSTKFQISQKLYGREKEIKLLSDAFDRVSQNMKELILIAGYSGIGKSSLVNELSKTIIKKGYFISGKCDQFQRSIPYFPLISAFKSMIKQILAENESEISNWRNKLLSAIGQNGQLIIDIIPEVKLLIGEQPKIVELSPTESQNRFNFLFQNFITAFISKEHPLVIFLDDLQWADSATIAFIDRIMTLSDIQNILILSAYRDNEVNDSHPLMITINEMSKKNIIINLITLNPLTKHDVTSLISDTLNCNFEDAVLLSGLCITKTLGNPFFINQLLLTLYEKGYIEYNLNKGIWTWDMEIINAINITDNVISLMTEKIQKLSEKTQQILQFAACIGSDFDLTILSQLFNLKEHDVLNYLESSIYEGLISPDKSSSSCFRFFHDRVQQAAYMLMDENKRKEIHLTLGRLIIKNFSQKEIDEKLFYVVNHLNLGHSLIQNYEEKINLANLNLIAAKKAKMSAAFEQEYSYLKVGIALLDENSWNNQYELTASLYTEIAEASYINTDFDESDKYVEIALNNIKSLGDKIPIYEVKISSNIARNNRLEATKIGLEILKKFGIKAPLYPNMVQVLFGVVNIKIALFKKNIKELINLPIINDPEIIGINRILKTSASSAYFISPNLTPFLTFKWIKLTINQGNSPISYYPYACYGVILCGVLFDIDSGYKFGKLALDLVEKFQAKEAKSNVVFIFNNFIRHWKEHVRDTLKPFLEGYQAGLETGNFEYASYSAQNYCYHLYFTGKELKELKQELINYDNILVKLKQKTVIYWNHIYSQVVSNLLEESEDPCQLIGLYYNENENLQIHIEDNDKVALFEVNFQKLILNYIFGRYEKAYDLAKETEKYIETMIACLSYALFYFYQSLTLIAVYPTVKKSEQKKMIRQVVKNQKKFKKWAHFAPMNHKHKYELIEAEFLRIKGKIDNAQKLYIKAIEGAKANGYIQEEALANELAAKFYISQGNEKSARVYMQDAIYLYQRWGAIAKVNDLNKKYPEFQIRDAILTVNSKKTITATISSRTAILDLATVIKASQAISVEIVLSKLLENMMHIVIENAGAQKGFVILEDEGQFFIEAYGSIETENICVLQRVAIQKTDNLPLSIINYVINTKEYLILNNPANEGSFSKDIYIEKNKSVSILCMPIINQGELTGILYLENNLISNAFTAERIELLKILSSQMAISIDNARLYTRLENKNKDLLRANLQIHHLLLATTEMSRTKNKVNASIIALKHMLAIEDKILFKQAQFYLPQQSGKSYTCYTILDDEKLIDNPSPFDINPDKKNSIKQLNEIIENDTSFLVPIKSKNKMLAAIEIIKKDNLKLVNDNSFNNFIEGIARSLSLTIENIESEENTRLAGIGSMAASIVHDLKNPIGVIIGYAEMALDRELSEKDRNEYLSIISKEATRMSNMAHEVLEFSRGEITLNIGEIESIDLGIDLAKLLKPIFENNDMIFNYESDYEGILTIDFERIRRVILNLATNARDAMLNQKHKNSQFILKTLRAEDGVNFLAEDNGPGIPEHIQAT
ncbi:MAG: AAA family ATPase, partial [Desulfobacterales bacterium]|nr:AAA family ATPase [Desulfobacterales bacterium]